MMQALADYVNGIKAGAEVIPLFRKACFLYTMPPCRPDRLCGAATLGFFDGCETELKLEWL